MINAIANIVGRSAIYGESAGQAAAAFISRVKADGGIVEAEQHLKDEIQHLKDIGVWDKLSAAWIPSGYAEGKLYAVKGGPEADLGFTRAGTRTRVGPNGLVEEVPYNLVASSSDYSSSTWQKINSIVVNTNATADPLGGNTGCELNANNSTTAAIYQNITLPYGRYAISFYIKKGTSNQSRFRFIAVSVTDNSQVVITWNGDTPVLTPSNAIDAYAVDVGNGWHRVVLVDDSSTATTSQRILLYPDESGGNGTLYVWGHQVVSGSAPLDYFPTINRQHVPAIDFTGGTPKLSLEKASTNLITRSNELTHSNWSKRGGITITPNAGVAPDGTMSATTATFSDAATNMSTNTIFVTPGQTYTFSWYVKQIDANAIGWGIFDITNSVWVVNSTLYTSELIFGEWVRLEKTFTVPVGCSGVLCYPTIMNSATGSVELWGHQLEQGSYATSYIPTGASTASRVVDAIPALTGVPNLIGQTEGSLLVDWTPTVSANEQEFNVDDGSAANRLRISLNPSNTNVSLSVVNGGVNQAATTASIVYGERYKILFTYKENEFKFYVNGTLIHTDTSGDVPSGMSAVRFTHPSAINRVILGGVHGVYLSKSVYSHDEAIALTTL